MDHLTACTSQTFRRSRAECLETSMPRLRSRESSNMFCGLEGLGAWHAPLRWSATTLPRMSGYRSGTETEMGRQAAEGWLGPGKPRGPASEELQRLAGGLSAQSSLIPAWLKESALRPPVPGKEFAWLAAIGMSSSWTVHRPKVRETYHFRRAPRKQTSTASTPWSSSSHRCDAGFHCRRLDPSGNVQAVCWRFFD